MGIKRATTSFGWMANVDGQAVPRVVTTGSLYDEADEVVRRFGEHFEDVDLHVDRRREARAEVEQATAAPGERRTVTKRSRSKRGTEEEQQTAEHLGLVDPDATD